jgi:hypothetical protein
VNYAIQKVLDGADPKVVEPALAELLVYVRTIDQYGNSRVRADVHDTLKLKSKPRETENQLEVLLGLARIRYILHDCDDDNVPAMLAKLAEFDRCIQEAGIKCTNIAHKTKGGAYNHEQYIDIPLCEIFNDYMARDNMELTPFQVMMHPEFAENIREAYNGTLAVGDKVLGDKLEKLAKECSEAMRDDADYFA